MEKTKAENNKKLATKGSAKKKPAKSPKTTSRYFDFYDDIKIDGRDIEW
jgi:hypothetical protein